MKKPGLMAAMIIGCLFWPDWLSSVTGQPAFSGDVLIREINPFVDHNHCTTRQFQGRPYRRAENSLAGGHRSRLYHRLFKYPAGFGWIFMDLCQVVFTSDRIPQSGTG
jgi:hypothetical protein